MNKKYKKGLAIILGKKINITPLDFKKLFLGDQPRYIKMNKLVLHYIKYFLKVTLVILYGKLARDVEGLWYLIPFTILCIDFIWYNDSEEKKDDKK